MTMSFRNSALLLLLLFLVLFFPKLALTSYDTNDFRLLSELLVTFTVAVTLYIRTMSMEKKLIIKTAELTDTLLLLKESDDKIKTLLVNLNVGVAVFSPQGELLLCNRKFIELESEVKLYNMSIHDTPTNLYNRNYFEHKLDEYLNKNTSGMVHQTSYTFQIGYSNIMSGGMVMAIPSS